MFASLSETEVKELFEQYYLGLVEFSWRITRCEESSRDIVQDVFVKLLENDRYLPIEGQRTKFYLYSMVKNASLNHLRRGEVAERYRQNSATEDFMEENILDALIYAESVQQLYSAIEALPEACQNICTVTFLEEKSNQEAAELTNTSINTVKTHKRRAVELLRKRLVPVMRVGKITVLFFF